ncbi:MAG: hypothetical protein IJA95_10110 [Bacteroidaceae bacterium]|nr:hypothetical protein [Bacteroides sp.]MBQ4589622.1 hypothetical protein [Bacteroidaceae bacterium]
MKRTHHLYYLLLTLLLLAGCNDPKHVTDTLTRAEALMDAHPDSAWTVLNTLSPDEMGQNRTRAHYALLYTQAQDKTYRDETNDSLISIAVDYYRHTDDARRKFLSYYYKGRVHFNAKDYQNATLCYMEAEQLADEVGDDYLVGLLYAELGRIYDIYYDYPKSLEAHQKAAECYERAGKIRHRNYMWLNQSSLLRSMNEYGEAERLLLMTLGSAKEEEDKALIKSCLGDWMMLCIEGERMKEAQTLYAELVLMIDEDYVSSSYMGKLAQMYATEHNFILANECLEKGWRCAESKSDSVSLYMASSDVYRLQGNGNLAYQELKKGVLLQNKDTRQALQQPVLTVQRDHLSEKLEFEAYKLRMRKLLNLVTILFFLLLLVVVVYVYVRVFKKQKKESELVISHLENENEKIEKEKGKIALALQQLDEDKRNADRTIATLKEEIDKKKEENNAKVMELKTKLQQEQLSVETLKQSLIQGKEKSDAEISALLEKMEEERRVANQMIQAQNEVIAQKEENRQKMKTLIQQLESDSKGNAESISRLRSELVNQEEEFRLYVQNAEAEMKALQDENRKMLFQKVELLRHALEQVVGVVLLHERKYLREETKVKRIEEGIKSLKMDYYAGDNEYNKVEALVNRYLDNVMVHFRREVILTNESEYRRVCYMFAGVSGQIIGEIMGESKDAVYQRRSRLLKKLGSLSCVHKDMFIVLLSK